MKEYRKDNWISSKVEIRASTIHGKGMFADAPIEQSEGVAVWGGRFVNRAKADKSRLTGKAIQQIEKDVFEVFDYDKSGKVQPACVIRLAVKSQRQSSAGV